MKKILLLCTLLCISMGIFAQGSVQGHPRPDLPPISKKAITLKSTNAFTMDDIKYWVGEGTNKAALVVQWNDDKNPDVLVWGYRWDGVATGEDMLNAIATVDKRFYLLAYSGTTYGTAYGGMGFDLDGEGTIGLALSGNVTYPKYPTNGIVNTSAYDFDDWAALDGKDHWQSGWYQGYWSYNVKEKSDEGFSYSALGASSRQLKDGSWDAWCFLPEFSGKLDEKFVAVTPYEEPTFDYSKGTFIVNEDWFGWSNGSVNFISDEYKIKYRAYRQENAEHTFGTTTQYGAIYGDKFYFISKQATKEGGRLVVADANTLKKIDEFENIGGGDGRSFVGVNDSTGYLGTSNGVIIFDIKNMKVGEQIEGTGGGNLYAGQIGNMTFAGKYVFAVRQSTGLLVIDVQTNKLIHTIEGSFNTVTQSKDGNVWIGAGSTLKKVNPFTLEVEDKSLPSGVTINGSWGAWNAGGFCASTQQNILYWTGGGSMFGGGNKVVKYDIDADAVIADFFELPGQKSEDGTALNYKQIFYGAGLRVDPVSDNIIITTTESGWGSHYQNNWVHFVDKDANLIKTLTLDNYYWFSAMPVFPDNFAPEINADFNNLLVYSDSSIYLGDKVSDKDNIAGSISKWATVNNASLADVLISNDSLRIIPKIKEGEGKISFSVNSNGKIVNKNIKLTIISIPEIVKQPVSNAIVIDESATFLVEATGGLLTYQWYKNNEAITDASSPTYKIDKVSLADNGSKYYCRVSNQAGNTQSDIVELSTKLELPIITQQPRAITASLNENVEFSTKASGGALTYQWYKDGNAIAGAILSSYQIKGSVLKLADAGEYYCITSNDKGKATSDKAQLKVNMIELVTATSINGNAWNVSDLYLVDKDYSDASIRLEIVPIIGATVWKDDKQITDNKIAINISRPSVQTVSYVVKAPNGVDNTSYNLKVEKRFNFDDIVITRWDNTLIVNGNTSTNGGFSFTGHKWFKDSQEVGSGQYYSVGAKKNDLLNGDYYVQLTTKDGQILRTWEKSIELKKSMVMKAYPNPLNPGETVSVQLDVDQQLLENATIEVYSMYGVKVGTTKTTGEVTSIVMPSQSGTYVIKVRSDNFVREEKLIVK